MQNIGLISISSVQHFLVDGLCMCCLFLLTGIYGDSFGAYGDRMSLGAILIYNLLAFLSQPLTGLLADRLSHRHWLLLWSALLLTVAVAVAMLPFRTEWALITVALLLGAGNSLFHVWGG